VNRQVESRKKSNPLAQRNKTILELTSLISQRNLALRRNDHITAEELSQQIISLGGDPATGQLVDGSNNEGDYESKIQKINENNKRRTKESMAAAHANMLQKKKTEEAFVRAKQYVAGHTLEELN
jgi:RNA polymerase-associated protein RTF1